MDEAWGRAYADGWARDWNARDIDALLRSFTADVVFTSPVAARVLPETGGVVRGKQALRHYWALALESVPDLHFEVVSVFVGVDSLVIAYRNQRGALVSEFLDFVDDLVVRGHAHYLTEGG